MKYTRLEKIVTSLFFIYTVIGLYGLFSFEYIDRKNTMRIVYENILIFLIVISICTNYYAFFYIKQQEKYLIKTVRFLAAFILTVLLLFITSEGVIGLINQFAGRETKYIIKGEILTIVRFEKLGIEHFDYKIRLEHSNEIIDFRQYKNQYSVGQQIEKQIKIGILGITYN